MSNYVKKYDVGEIALDLPYNSFIHELPLLSFKDFRNSVSISLIHNHKLKIDNSNLFNVGVGYKLNIQKKIIIENNVPTKLIESNGKYVNLISNSNSLDSTVSNGLYTFDDESKRILRVLSNGFEIENYDFSKEKYNSLGNIIESYDKYGDEYLTYTYDSSNKLINISYNGKVVSFGYYNNDLTSISYGGTTTTLVYNNPNMTIIHYSGVRYYITVTDTEYTVVGRDTSGSGIFSKSKICEYSGNEIVLKNKIKTDIIDEVTYRFPSSVTSGYKSYTQVEITSKGVQQRVQYYNDKLLYSYELENDYGLDEVQFYNGECVCDINVHKTLNEDFTNSFSGKIKPHDGIRMYKPLELENKFEICIKKDPNNNNKFNFLLTGWMRSTNLDNTISIQKSNSEEICSFNVPVSEPNKWHFFAYQFETDRNYIQVIASNENVSLADLRIICQVTHIIDADDVSHAVYKEDILIDQLTEEVYTFTQGDFYYETLDNKTGIIELSISDLTKYLMRNIKNDGMNEITYNDGKNVINNISSVTFKLSNSVEEKDVLSYSIGYRYYREDDEYDTYYKKIYYDPAEFFTTNRKNKTPYSRQYLNEYFDVVKTEEDFSTTYTRDKGLLTEEKVENLYYKSYTYNTGATYNTIEITDKYSNPERIQKYYFDPVWGTVYKKEKDNVIVEEDTYDDDKSVLLKKKFTNIEHLYGYDEGNLSSLSCGDLVYNFEYTKDKLSLVNKFNSPVEEQAHTDFSSTIYYPSQTNMVFSKQYNFDKYGRLISIPNELENIYCFYRHENPYGSEVIDEIDNGESKLVTSEDKLKNRTSYYSYSINDLLTKKRVVETSGSIKEVSCEEFDYDTVKRLTEKTFVIHGTSDLTMKDTLTYKKSVTDPNIDDTVATSSYFINDTLLANTSYQYDTFKRISNHIINFNGKSLKKVYTYNKDKLNEVETYVSNILKSTDEYSYDSLNRISSVTSGNKTISYEYDVYGRLKRENNELLDKTIIYDYNDIGNIVTNNTYQYTVAASPSTLLSSKSYTYDSTNKDRLINFNGTDISYNTLGCPTTLNGYNLTWNNGKLTKYAKGNVINGQEGYTYSYNAYGQRVSKAFSKTAGRNGLNPLIKSEITSYNKIYNYDHNGRLINEICEVTLHEDGTYKESIDYIYDVNTIIGMRYTKNNVTSTYYFDRNVFGDVVGIYDTNGDLKVKYLYDAYGNCTISNETTNQGLAILNPIRYRGYYYDVETSLFWLSSRYYSPELCRFISPDDVDYLDPESVNGLNLYCYCYNNPISYCDPSGHSAILVGLIIGAIVGASIGFGAAAYIDYQDDGQIFNGSVAWYDYLGATVLGGAAGAAIGAGIGYIAPHIGSALSSFAAQKFTIGAGLSFTSNGAAAMSAGLTITGAQILQGAALLAEVTVMAAILGKSGGYTVKQFPNDHDPAHVHIFGDDIADKAHGIRIGIDGNPLPGQGKLPPGAKKALKKLWEKILRALLK